MSQLFSQRILKAKSNAGPEKPEDWWSEEEEKKLQAFIDKQMLSDESDVKKSASVSHTLLRKYVAIDKFGSKQGNHDFMKVYAQNDRMKKAIDNNIRLTAYEMYEHIGVVGYASQHAKLQEITRKKWDDVVIKDSPKSKPNVGQKIAEKMAAKGVNVPPPQVHIPAAAAPKAAKKDTLPANFVPVIIPHLHGATTFVKMWQDMYRYNRSATVVDVFSLIEIDFQNALTIAAADPDGTYDTVAALLITAIEDQLESKKRQHLEGTTFFLLPSEKYLTLNEYVWSRIPIRVLMEEDGLQKTIEEFKKRLQTSPIKDFILACYKEVWRDEIQAVKLLLGTHIFESHDQMFSFLIQTFLTYRSTKGAIKSTNLSVSDDNDIEDVDQILEELAATVPEPFNNIDPLLIPMFNTSQDVIDNAVKSLKIECLKHQSHLSVNQQINYAKVVNQSSALVRAVMTLALNIDKRSMVSQTHAIIVEQKITDFKSALNLASAESSEDWLANRWKHLRQSGLY